MAWRRFCEENIRRVKDEPGLYFLRSSLPRFRDQYYGMTYKQGLRTRLLQHWNARPGHHDYLTGLLLDFDVKYCVGWSKEEIEKREKYLVKKYKPWQNIQHHPRGHSPW